MLSDKFTFLELLDLSLRLPEVGAVNFNILHTVLTHLVLHLGLDSERLLCYIGNEAEAQAAIIRGRIEDPSIRVRQQRAGSVREFTVESASSEDKKVSTKEEPEKDVVTESSAITESSLQLSDTDDTPEKAALAEKVAKELLEKSDEGATKEEGKEDLKALAEEDIFEADPTKVVQEMWRAININRRMDGAEETLKQQSNLLDDVWSKVWEMEDTVSRMEERLHGCLERIAQGEEKYRALEDSIDSTNQQNQEKIEAVKDLIEDISRRQDDSALDDIVKRHERLSKSVAYKKDLEAFQQRVSDTLTENEKETRKRIQEMEDLIAPKEEFAEMVSRVDQLNELKVSREELGLFLEPGFMEKLIGEQENLRKDVEKSKESNVEEALNDLITRIDGEILRSIDESFAEVKTTIETMGMKLDTLDTDDINESLAQMEEQIDVIVKEQGDLKSSTELFEKEARLKLKTIHDVSDTLIRLESTKVDKVKLYELLESKADIEMVSDKLDRSEFIVAVKDVKDNLKNLRTVVQINGEDMTESFRKVRHELSLKMYREDFITATEPIRNRIKAILYEQKRIKEIALAHLLPDAPAVQKCFSCKRGANFTGRENFLSASPDKAATSPHQDRLDQ